MFLLLLLAAWPVQLLRYPVRYLSSLWGGPDLAHRVNHRFDGTIDQLLDHSRELYLVEVRGH